MCCDCACAFEKNANALSPHCTQLTMHDKERESKGVARKDVYERGRDMARGRRHHGAPLPPHLHTHNQQYVKLTEYINIVFIAQILIIARFFRIVHLRLGFFFKLNS